MFSMVYNLIPFAEGFYCQRRWRQRRGTNKYQWIPVQCRNERFLWKTSKGSWQIPTNHSRHHQIIYM